MTSASLPVSDWVGPTVRSQNGGQDMYLGLYWNDQNTELRVAAVRAERRRLVPTRGHLHPGRSAARRYQLALSAVGSTLSFQEDGIERITATHTSLTGGAPA